MHHLDDVQLYDLSEAGRLLYRDPVRLIREARHRRVPSARIPSEGPEGLGFPAAWVDAMAGTRAEDPEALREKWLARLAPPSPDAHRAARSREDLPVDTLLTPDEAARHLCASVAALQRLDEAGVVPSLRVDGARHYDAEIIEALARRAAGESVDEESLAARHAQLRSWIRFEYRSAEAPTADAAEEPATTESEETPTPPKPSRLIRAEGFETVDDDED